ncbi:MAG: CRISPR-associated protein Cas5 [Candidatus Thermoplasmatota archaeon]
MYGVRIKTDIPYFANFRKPTSTSNLTTYSIPPYTTIRGLLSNALGLMRDDYKLQDWNLKIGIEPNKQGDKNIELTKILKLVARERAFKCKECGFIMKQSTKRKKCKKCEGEVKEIPNYKRNFPSAPMFQEFIVQPSFDIYLISSKENIQKINKAIKNPKRPLYLGNSENLVTLKAATPIEVDEKMGKQTSTVVEGFHKNSFIEKLPYKFHKTGRRFQLEYKTVSIPKGEMLKFRKEKSLFEFNGKKIFAI